MCAFFEIRNQTVKDQPLSPSVHCEAQPSTISHQLSTARKELSSNELGRTPGHRPDRLTADQQHTVPARPVKAHFALFRRERTSFANTAKANPRRLKVCFRCGGSEKERLPDIMGPFHPSTGNLAQTRTDFSGCSCRLMYGVDCPFTSSCTARRGSDIPPWKWTIKLAIRTSRP